MSWHQACCSEWHHAGSVSLPAAKQAVLQNFSASPLHAPFSLLLPQLWSCWHNPTYEPDFETHPLNFAFFSPPQSKLQHLNLKKGNVSKKSGGIALQCLLKTSVTHPAASPEALHRRTRPTDVSLWGVTVISFCHLPVSREAKSLPDSVKMLLNYVFCLELKTATWSEAGTLVTWPKALSDLVNVLFPLTKGKQQAICSLFEWLRLTEQRIICSDILNLGS